MSEAVASGELCPRPMQPQKQAGRLGLRQKAMCKYQHAVESASFTPSFGEPTERPRAHKASSCCCMSQPSQAPCIYHDANIPCRYRPLEVMSKILHVTQREWQPAKHTASPMHLKKQTSQWQGTSPSGTILDSPSCSSHGGHSRCQRQVWICSI